MPESATLEQRTIESIPRGTLSQSFGHVEDWTSIQLAYQVCNDRLKELRAVGALDEEGKVDANKLRNALKDNSSLLKWYGWTGTGAMYKAENGKAVLYLSNDVRNNLVLRPENIEEAVRQLRQTNDYKSSEEDASDVIRSVSAGTTARVEYDARTLKLVKDNDEWSHFVVDTVNYDKLAEQGYLNDEQRELAERNWGNGKAYNKGTGFSVEFKQYMAVLNAAGKKTTNFCVLTPEYVKQHAKDGAISRVSWLFDFYYNSDFSAGDRLVDSSNGGLRGVRRKVAEGDASQNVPGDAKETADPDYKKALDTLLGNPQEALKHLDDKTALGLLQFSTAYYTARQQ
ncbi:hypothetical protein HYU06_04415 [Candidatus Woesearchaeota archaeon]|nr:hypothetical protein [Candidatus Woesearchaeota archaeon]